METLRIDPEAVDLEGMIERGVELHGHLGPYLVAGIRMGLLALGLLGSAGYFGISAVSEAGRKPPMSCLSDGVQIGSGCTAGKGNLKITDAGQAQVHFHTEGGAAMTIRLRPEMVQAFAEGDCNALSRHVSACPLEELFTWEMR